MTAPQTGSTHDATVVLDIGGDIGAVVLDAPDWLAGQEIEICPKDGDATGARPTHPAVRVRRTRSGTRFAAVFAAVEAGEYDVRCLRHPSMTSRTVTVVGGQVTETLVTEVHSRRPVQSSRASPSYHPVDDVVGAR